MNFNSMAWFDPCALYWVAFSFLLNGLIVYLWHKRFYIKWGLIKYKAIQRIHLNETPRLGGVVFVLSLIGFGMTCNFLEPVVILKQILICLIPILITALKEDIFHNVDPLVRLISLLLVGWFFRMIYIAPLPNLTEVPIVSKFILLPGGVSFFYILGMTAIANGTNLLDGVHGLCSAVVLSILSALLFLSYKNSDVVMISLIFNIMLILIPFIFFNYPYGKIFLGDLGAYSLGLVISMLTIIFFGRHPEISPWAAVLVLIYPITEIIFTIFRRIWKRSSLFKPDTDHLHIKFFYFFRAQNFSIRKIANPLVTPILSCLWLFPLTTITWVYHKVFFIWVAIFIFLMIYIIFFANVPHFKKNISNMN